MRSARTVLVATSLAAFTATLDNTVVAVALRSMQQGLHAGVTGLQGVVTAYTVALAALLLAGGALVDVLGAKRVLLTGLVIFGGASAGCGWAGSVDALVLWRALQGAGAALLLPGGLAVLAAAYPDPVAQRRAVGIWAAAGGTALVAGPVVGGLLVSSQGWQAVFWINVPLSMLVAGVVLRIQTVAPTPGRRLDLWGALFTCTTLGAAAWAVVVAGRSGLSTTAAALLGASVVCALLLAVVEKRVKQPLLPGGLMRDRRFGGGALGAFAASLAVFVLLVFVSLFLQLVQSSDARGTGLVLLPLPLALVVTAPLAGRWKSVAAPVVMGLLVAGGGLLVLGLTLTASTSHPALGVLLAVVGAGVGLTTAPVVTAALTAAGKSQAGVAAASVSVARELGGVVAVAGLGALAVSRLTHQLSAILVSSRVPAGQRPALLDALLSAQTDQSRRLFAHAVSVNTYLRVGPTFADRATASFVSSTQLILIAAGAGLLMLGLFCGFLLRPLRHNSPASSPAS